MADEPSYIKKLRTLTRADPEFKDLEAIEQELYASLSDRATAVMFGSFVETNLEQLLAKAMRSALNSKDRQKLFYYEGAVGTFASKIVVAYAFKLIGPITRGDLDWCDFSVTNLHIRECHSISIRQKCAPYVTNLSL